MRTFQRTKSGKLVLGLDGKALAESGIGQAATAAALKAVSGSAQNDICYVVALTAFFQYERYSTATGNDTTVIAPTDGIGRWLVVDGAVLPILQQLMADPDYAAHVADTEGAHAASAISIADAGNKFTATEVEAALAEVKTLADAAATAANLTAHLNDATDAHDASAISIADAGTKYTATDVEAALAEVKTLADAAATAANLTAHIDDASAAHAASAISVADAGNKFTATDVEAVLAELEARVAALESA